VTVGVDLAGHKYPFVLDTGSSGWVLDDSLRPLLRPPTGRVRTDIASFTDLFGMPQARVGAMEVAASTDVICAPLQEDGAPVGADVYGILPMEFLRDKIFRLTSTAARCCFWRGCRKTRANVSR
jgi:hypothetical protein